MHTRTPGPKQTIPVRLVAGCDNQIGNFPLWGVRWSAPRRRRPRPAESLVPFTAPHMSDSPHTHSPPPESVLVLRPSLTQQGGSIASKPSSVTASSMRSPVDACMARPADAMYGGDKLFSTSHHNPSRPWRDYSAAPAYENVLPILLPSTSTLHLLPQPELSVTRQSQGLHIREALSTCNDLPLAPVVSNLSTKFERPSSSPTPSFPVNTITHTAPDTLTSYFSPSSPQSLVEDSIEYPGDDAVDYHNDDVPHASLRYPPGYILSSHSELAAFASTDDFVPQAQAPDHWPIVSSDGPFFPSQW